MLAVSSSSPAATSVNVATVVKLPGVVRATNVADCSLFVFDKLNNFAVITVLDKSNEPSAAQLVTVSESNTNKPNPVSM